MLSLKKLRLLYVIFILVLFCLLALSWVYEKALFESELHQLQSQAQLLSLKYRKEIMGQEYRTLMDAFGVDVPNVVVTIFDDSHHEIFKSRRTQRLSLCADSNIGQSSLHLQLCRVSGPFVSFREAIWQRAKWLMLMSVLVIGSILFLFVRTVKSSVLDSLQKISSAIGSSPISRLTPLDSLLKILSTQKNQIQIFEEKVAAQARLAAIGAVTSQFQHDIKNPLSVIRVALGDANSDPLLQRSAQDAIQRIQTMMTEMGQFSKSLQMHLTEVSVSEVVKTIVTEMKIQHPQMIFETYVDSRIAVRADFLGLIRVITNVVNNAMEALSSKVLMVANLSDEKENQVEINISDWGNGLNPKVKENLFKPFVTFGKTHGMGLGLWHGSQMITAMNGSIHVFSPGKQTASTTVQIFLPKWGS